MESHDNCMQLGLVLPQPSSKNVIILGIVSALLRKLQKSKKEDISNQQLGMDQMG
jgi:hypothetical protein